MWHYYSFKHISQPSWHTIPFIFYLLYNLIYNLLFTFTITFIYILVPQITSTILIRISCVTGTRSTFERVILTASTFMTTSKAFFSTCIVMIYGAFTVIFFFSKSRVRAFYTGVILVTCLAFIVAVYIH